MPTGILSTKLHTPLNRPNVIERDRLIETLNAGTQRKLTLLCAPAGFGKTTLATTWLAHADRPVAWLSLDDSENDPLQFLSYFIAAIESVAPDFGATLQEQLRSPQPPSAGSLLVPLINELDGIENSLILVLDDYHLIEEPQVSETLAQIVQYLPANVHLVITTREDPPLPLARYRAQHQITEVRAHDLRFTVDEAAQFFTQVMELDLPPDTIAALEERTEGWIAGLQLAALSMQGVDDTAGFVESFTGSHQYVLDYLVEEVLHHQPDDVQQFLLFTSVLDRFCSPLCDAVLQREDSSQTTLEYLQRANLFLIPLDNERRWYRYHHLFADLLRLHFNKQYPGMTAELHTRASEWYEANNMPSEAIAHALTAQDHLRAATLIEMEWPALFNGYRPITWYRWVAALPQSLVRTRPQLSLGATWVSLHEGNLAQAEHHLQDAARWLEDPTDPELVIVNEKSLFFMLPGILNIRIYLAAAHGDLPAAIDFARDALERIDPQDNYHCGLVHTFLGMAHWHEGDLARAHELLSESLVLMQRAPNAFFTALCATLLATMDQEYGRLHTADSHIHQALELSLGSSGYGLLELAERHMAASALCRERDQLDEAKQHLEHARQDLTEQALLPGRAYRWHIAMAQLRISQGRLDVALEQLEQARSVYKPDPIPDRYAIDSMIAHVWVLQGRLDEAASWAQRAALSSDDDIPYLREFDYLTLAQLRIAQGSLAALDEALALLQRLLTAADGDGRAGTAIRVLVQLALAHHARGEQDAALESLARALTLAAPEGYVRAFVDHGQPIADLLNAASARGSQPEYARRLLAILRSAADTPAEQPLIDPLSERELEVLGLIEQGLTNNQIAETLVIALSTVKGHNQRIFEKLQVYRRTEAVSRAREIGLL